MEEEEGGRLDRQLREKPIVRGRERERVREMVLDQWRGNGMESHYQLFMASFCTAESIFA